MKILFKTPLSGIKSVVTTGLLSASLLTISNAATILPLENFEGGLGAWTNTAGSAIHYIHLGSDQPSGNATHNFASAGGTGAVDLRKSGGQITSPTLILATLGSPDLTISLDYQIHNGSTTRRSNWELSLNGGFTWFSMGLTQTGGGIANDTAGYTQSVTIVEGVAGGTIGGTSPHGSVSYDGSAFTDNALVRFTNVGSAGADYRQFYDNISITSTGGNSIPEPTSTALLGLGGLALILRRRK
jgi:hypothetical protein